MKLLYEKKFLKSAQKLPAAQQRKLAGLLELLQEDPLHPLLHTKHLTGSLAGFLSFRFTRDWRVIFRFIDSETIQLIHVAHRKDIYR